MKPTPRCEASIKILRGVFHVVDSLDPHDQDIVYRAVLDHVRARRPESGGVLGVLPPPTEPIRDPRTDAMPGENAVTGIRTRR